MRTIIPSREVSRCDKPQTSSSLATTGTGRECGFKVQSEDRMSKSLVVRRRLGGAIIACGPVLVGFAAILWLVGAFPENDDNLQQTKLAFLGIAAWFVVALLIGEFAFRICLTPISLVPLGWFGLKIIEEIMTLYRSPDLNQDGIFTIKDLPSIIFDIIIAPGKSYIELIKDEWIFSFFEMGPGGYPIFWAIILTAFGIWISFYLVISVWTWKPDYTQD